MPRDGSNVYSPPGGTTATTLTPISSSAYNSFVADIAQDQNAARPVTAGGTGATNAADARTNLGAGNVHGPTTTVDNTVPRFDGTDGDIQTSGVVIDDSNNVTMGGVLTATKTDDGATGAQIITQHISASPAASDVIADWIAQGKDSGGNTITYGDIQHIITDPTDAAEDGVWAFLTRVAGTLAERFRVGAGLYMQGATGGDKGAGTINATGFYKNGTVLGALLHLQDQKSAGTDGGTFNSGDWRTRTLNTEVTDEIGSTLSSNQFTLPAGTYEIRASAPGTSVGSHKTRLQNITDGTTALVGTAEFAPTSVTATSSSFVTGRFTIAAEKTFEFQHRCSNSQSNNGGGSAAGFGTTEIYADVMIWRVA